MLDSLVFLTVPDPKPFSDFMLFEFAADNEKNGTKGDGTPHLSGCFVTKVQSRAYMKSVEMRRQEMTEKETWMLLTIKQRCGSTTSEYRDGDDELV
jgi:hypothetical protein